MDWKPVPIEISQQFVFCAAVHSSAIEVAVGALDHAAGGIVAVGAIGLAAKRVQGSQGPGGRKLERRPAATPRVGALVRAAPTSGAIEVAVLALDQTGGRTVAVSATSLAAEGVKGGQRA